MKLNRIQLLLILIIDFNAVLVLTIEKSINLIHLVS